jgi:hypothetical protein
LKASFACRVGSTKRQRKLGQVLGGLILDGSERERERERERVCVQIT